MIQPLGVLQDHRAREVAAGRRDVEVIRAEAEVAGVAVEQGAEDAGRVEPGQAQPLDVAAGRDQGHRLAVGQEAVVADGWER